MSFTYIASAADWARIAPELVLAGVALLILLVDLLLPQTGAVPRERGAANFFVLPLLALLGVLGALAATIVLFVVGDGQRAFFGLVGSDWGSLYAYLAILSAAGLGIIFSPAYLKRLKLVHQGEYYALFLAATLGMMLLAAATSFMTLFLGLETLSLALYILCGFVTRRQSSQEAGMKYFLLSSFASAFLLYGVALIYGATGTTRFGARGTSAFPGVLQFLQAHPQSTTLLLIGIGLLTVGFAFKVSAIPFQMWTPDVYEGAPAPVTAFMSVGTKAAALVAFARVFAVVLEPVAADWQAVVWALAVLTMVGGNLLALVQRNAKRLLAYSSVAHAGYLLIGVVGGGATGLAAILFYLLCYAFLNAGAFGALSALERLDNSGCDREDLRGLWFRRPWLAGFLAFFLLGLAGFPPMAGFAAKYYLFFAALQGGHPELLLIGVLTSVLGMYYYLRLIAAMFMEPAREVQAGSLEVTPALAVAGAGAGAGVAPRASGPLGRAASTRTGGASTGAAVAVKTAAQATTRRAPEVEQAPETREQATEEGALAGSSLSWTTWLGLGLAALGALALGTVLPFWLVDLALKAAATL
ncbi:NADH-quinone oxidoreductase subunit N [Thermogemmatispora aurantia]|uniref:NADH-quinone oxidoreductase subunit N n=1 Tax=Thermogemmatispora aurantia TaxID=2045279 RepID=A0A5J4KJW0_9CHLR|nr:NADH-quinone oxidoreductase subunit N [Thermogemmatispora aurantia]GER85636.1 NADH-quinone oxidoreductase subunit N [Thermogemmatispora aurantia]